MGCFRQILPLAAILPFCGLTCQRSPLTDGLPAKLDCSSCHGNKDNAAPPLALNGSTSTSDNGVGAHQAHMTGGYLRTSRLCRMPPGAHLDER